MTDEDQTEDELRAVRMTAWALRHNESVTVKVAGPRWGSVRERWLSMHPVTRAILDMTAMTDMEFAGLQASIRRSGVHTPLILFQGRVLDGLHRLAVASAWGLAVQIEEFVGDEEAARHRWVQANVLRQHLTVDERALVEQKLADWVQ